VRGWAWVQRAGCGCGSPMGGSWWMGCRRGGRRSMGTGHPVLDAAVTDQLGRMSYVMFGGLSHEPAVSLARALVDVTPPGLEHVFLWQRWRTKIHFELFRSGDRLGLVWVVWGFEEF
jgi:hypothetical protein